MSLDNKTLHLFFFVTLMLTAVFSEGYFYYDEHFQILEFLNYKLGRISSDELPWEFGERIRPWLQPLLSLQIVKVVKLMGLEHPSHWVMALRLVSGLLAFCTVRFLVGSLELSRKNSSNISSLTLLSFVFLCFFPVHFVRHSAENWGGLFALLAYALEVRNGANLDDGKKISAAIDVLIGVVWSLAFTLRFQIGFMILGYGLWKVIFRRTLVGEVIAMTTGFVGFQLIAAVVDCWGYGVWVYPPWNYFVANVVEGRMNQWGSHPFWYYLPLLWKHLPPLFGGVAFFLPMLFFARNPKKLLTWMLGFFFLGHCLASHKEGRFLVPYLYFFPVVLAYLARDAGVVNAFRRVPLFLTRGLTFILILVNLIYFIQYTFFPLRNDLLMAGPLFEARRSNLVFWQGKSPMAYGSTETYFFRWPGLELTEVKGLDDAFSKAAGENFYFHRQAFLGPPHADDSRCRLEYQPFHHQMKKVIYENVPFLAFTLRRTESQELYFCSY